MMDEQIMPSTKTLVFINSGWGEIGLYYALQRPEMTFVSIDKDEEKSSVARNVAENRVSNMAFYEDYKVYESQTGLMNKDCQVILLDPSDKDINDYSFLNPIIIK